MAYEIKILLTLINNSGTNCSMYEEHSWLFAIIINYLR